MANGTLVLGVELIGEFKKLADAVKGGTKSLGSLDDNAKKISKGINTALGAIGVGFSLAAITNQFKESTKAAIEDAKSKALLTQALKTNLRATDAQINSVEKYIGKLQITTSITDDQLRPAFQKLALSTGDTSKAMDLLAVATDVAAGTGKSLDTVAQAMAKALEGNTTALDRLVPSVKGSKDPLAELAATFEGAAEAAANTDPYARMEIIFGELQEQIGTALLPILEDFSTWLATPEGQEKLQGIADGVTNMVDEFTKMSEYLGGEVMPTLESLTGEKGLGAVFTSIQIAIGAIATLKIAMMIFTASNPWLAGILAGLALLATAIAYVTTQYNGATDAAKNFQRITKSGSATGSFFSSQSGTSGTGFTGTSVMPNVPSVNAPKGTAKFTGTTIVPQSTINVNINGTKATAADIVKEIQKYEVQTGTRYFAK